MFFASSADAKTLSVKGKQIRGVGKTPNQLIAEDFLVPLGGAVIKSVHNSSSEGFFIEGEGEVSLLNVKKGENPKGIRLGPGRYRVFPNLQNGHRSDTVRLELEPQKTGEWVTKGGRHHIQKFRPR